MTVLDIGSKAVSGKGADRDFQIDVCRAGDAGADEDDVPDGAAVDVAEETDIIEIAADGEAADGVLAAVVGAVKAAGAYHREVATAAEVDVFGLAEGLSAAVVGCGADGSGEVAQVVGVGYLVGRIVHGTGGSEELSAKGGTQLRVVGAPV